MSDSGGRRVSTTFSDYLDGGVADGVPLWRGPRPAGHRSRAEGRPDVGRRAGDRPARGGRPLEVDRSDTGQCADRDAAGAGAERSGDVPPSEGAG